MKAIDLAAVVGAGDSPEDAGFDEEAYLGGGGLRVLLYLVQSHFRV